MQEIHRVCYGSIIAEWKKVALGTGSHVVKSWLYPLFSAYYCYSVSKPCPTLCNPVDYSMLGLLVLHHPPEFAQVIVH